MCPQLNGPLVRKACLLRKACFCGVSARRNPTKKLMCKISPSAGLTDLHCKLQAEYHCKLFYMTDNSRCALIHCHRPDLIDYDKLDKVNPPPCRLRLYLFYFPVVDRPPWQHASRFPNSSRPSRYSCSLLLSSACQ